MIFRCWPLAALLVTFVAVSGCAYWKKETKSGQYETIAANPSYDSAAAEKSHASAIFILDGYFAGKKVNLAEAENLLQKALVADVTYGPAHNTLGIVYMVQRKNYLAAWEFEYASKLMPEQIEPIYNLGRLYEDADKLDNAIAYYEQALAMSPRDGTIIGSLAAAQLKSGLPLDAVRPLLETLVFADHRPEWIAWAQDQLGRHPIQVDFAELAPTTADPPTPPTPLKTVPLPPPPMSRNRSSGSKNADLIRKAAASFPSDDEPEAESTGRASTSG